MAKRKPNGGRRDVHVYLDEDIMSALRQAAEKNDRSIQGELRATLRKIYVERMSPA